MTQRRKRSSLQDVPIDATMRNWQLFRIAGRDAAEFETQRTSLEAQLRATSWEGGILGCGALRYGFAAADSQQALERLAAGSAGEAHDGVTTRFPVTAFVFPGLGGEIFDRFNELTALGDSFHDILVRADVITTARLGAGVAELVRRYAGSAAPGARERRLLRGTPASATAPTAVAHATLYTIECALAQTWLEWGVRPQYVSGYSLGEYSAACAAGLFSFEAGLSMVIDRAIMLVALPRSGMIAVGALFSDISNVLPPEVHLVAENSTEQTILGGSQESLEQVTRSLRAAGHVVRVMPVEHAFHTPLMAPVTEKLATLFAMVEITTPAIPMVSTVTGELIDGARLRDPAHWARHLCEPVQFLRALDTLGQLGTDVFLEVGPGQTLSPLIESHLRHRSSVTVVPSMPSDYDSRQAPEYLLRTAASLWERGVPIGDVPVISIRDLTSSTLSKPTASTSDDSVIRQIQAIWCEVLRRSPIGPDESLFDLGGNSLLTARIAMQIRRQLNIELSLSDLYTSPTPRRLAIVIGEGHRLRSATDLITLPNGLSIRCQSRAEARYFYRSIFEERAYLRNDLRIEPGATILDVGANIGMFSLFAALEAPGVRLYSCEPVTPLFEMLHFNLADVCENATLLNVGIAAEAGESVITYYPNSPGMSSFQADRNEEQTVLQAILRNSHAVGDAEAGDVLADRADFMDARFLVQRLACPMKTLSGIIHEYDLATVDLLKIDVQKLEMQVLGGIAEQHWSRIHQIAIEIHDHQNRMNDARELLSARGFNVSTEQDPLYAGTDIYNLYAAR